MAHATRPVVEIVSGTAAKRKREASAEAADVSQIFYHEAKRLKPISDLIENLSPPNMKPEGEVNMEAEPAIATPVGQNRVCEAIESQLSLEILLKHNELRLINQELAKCQVALEQLRRCHLIPYPTSQGTTESILNIVNGTGPALHQGANVPKWAPPYGVTDGPYARHYAKWLIPDPSFDGIQADWQRGFEGSRAGKTIPEGRATRHSIAEGVPGGKSRSQRGLGGSQKLQALSSGYAQPKEKAGPCVLKRGDGQMVKLVCLDCQRENFSSTQGFINHCRIAHHRDFKSHEEAAVACGHAIEIDEVGGLVGEEKPSAIANGLVHPLVRSAPITKEAISAVMSRINASLELYKAGDPRVPRIPTSATTTHVSTKVTNPSPNFVASSSMPFLSEMMKLSGFDQDFNEIVGDATKKVDFDDESESEDTESQTPTQQPGSLDRAESSKPPMRVPARAGVSPAPLGRPVSSKGLGTLPRPSFATPVINTVAANQGRSSSRLITISNSTDDHVHHHNEPDIDLEMIDGPSMTMIDLSPNTVASNKPPSLVSDDGEYDDGTDAERESSVEEDEDSDVAEIDIEDDAMDKVVPLRNRGGTASEALRLRKEEKHVTFVSPVKEKERRPRRT